MGIDDFRILGSAICKRCKRRYNDDLDRCPYCGKPAADPGPDPDDPDDREDSDPDFPDIVPPACPVRFDRSALGPHQ